MTERMEGPIEPNAFSAEMIEAVALLVRRYSCKIGMPAEGVTVEILGTIQTVFRMRGVSVRLVPSGDWEPSALRPPDVLVFEVPLG